MITDCRKHGMKIGEPFFDVSNIRNPIPVAGGTFVQESLLTEFLKMMFDYEPRGHFRDFSV